MCWPTCAEKAWEYDGYTMECCSSEEHSHVCVKMIADEEGLLHSQSLISTETVLCRSTLGPQTKKIICLSSPEERMIDLFDNVDSTNQAHVVENLV